MDAVEGLADSNDNKLMSRLDLAKQHCRSKEPHGSKNLSMQELAQQAVEEFLNMNFNYEMELKQQRERMGTRKDDID